MLKVTWTKYIQEAAVNEPSNKKRKGMSLKYIRNKT